METDRDEMRTGSVLSPREPDTKTATLNSERAQTITPKSLPEPAASLLFRIVDLGHEAGLKVRLVVCSILLSRFLCKVRMNWRGSLALRPYRTLALIPALQSTVAHPQQTVTDSRVRLFSDPLISCEMACGTFFLPRHAKMPGTLRSLSYIRKSAAFSSLATGWQKPMPGENNYGANTQTPRAS